MADFIKTQNSFAYGEIAPEFFARDDIAGLAHLENMDVTPGGGLTRRAGLTPIATPDGVGRLIAFSVSEEQNYLVVLGNKSLWMYDGATRIRSIQTPWNADDVSRVQYAQRFGTMIFVHPDFAPQVLRREGSLFTLTEFGFARNDADMTLNMPFMKFDDADGVKITLSAHSSGNNFATLTTNKDFWTADNVGGRLELLGKQWVVQSYVDSKHVVAYTNGTYTIPSAAVADWREAAFGTRRGWPCSISFHQDRLVFGGSRAWPSGVWMSQVGRHNNFNVGTGLDDEAIFITLLSQQRQQICTVVSSDNLQILTSVGEWAISSKPLTPASVDIKQHTSVGSVATRYLPPQKIEGATVFISRNGRDIRELALDELGENYNARDLCAFAKHMMKNPVDVAYNPDTRQLFVVMADGDMAVLNQNSALGISAWARYKTLGQFKSVAVIGGKTYVMVTRGAAPSIECFDTAAMRDATTVDFAFSASALPVRASGHGALRLRLRKITARVLNTKGLFINDTRATLPNSVYDAASPGFTGDVCVGVLGTQHNCSMSPWRIHGVEPMPATILSVTMHGRYTV